MVSLSSGGQQDSWSWSRNSRLSLSRPGIGLGLDRISKSRQVLVLVLNKISGLAELCTLQMRLRMVKLIGPEPCVHDDKGVFHLHGQAQKKLKPRKVWAKGKNGLFGWKYARSTYYVCGMVTKPDPGIPGPTFVSMRNSSRGNENSIASSQGYNSRNVANKRLGDKN